MVRLLGHRQTKGAATDNTEPNVTAPHLDSTDFVRIPLAGPDPGKRQEPLWIAPFVEPAAL
jgi:hypothetical protein